MYAVIGIIVVALLLILVVLPFLKNLLAFLGNFVGAVIGIAILLGAIALCIIFPVLLVPAIIFVIYSLSKGKAGNEKACS